MLEPDPFSFILPARMGFTLLAGQSPSLMSERTMNPAFKACEFKLSNLSNAFAGSIQFRSLIEYQLTAKTDH